MVRVKYAYSYSGFRMAIRDAHNRQISPDYTMPQQTRHTNENRYNGGYEDAEGGRLGSDRRSGTVHEPCALRHRRHQANQAPPREAPSLRRMRLGTDGGDVLARCDDNGTAGLCVSVP